MISKIDREFYVNKVKKKIFNLKISILISTIIFGISSFIFTRFIEYNLYIIPIITLSIAAVFSGLYIYYDSKFKPILKFKTPIDLIRPEIPYVEELSAYLYEEVNPVDRKIINGLVHIYNNSSEYENYLTQNYYYNILIKKIYKDVEPINLGVL